MVAACEGTLPDDESPLPDVVLLLPDPVFPELVSSVEEAVETEDPEGLLPGDWHCHEGSGAHEPSSCCRHCAYAVPLISKVSHERTELSQKRNCGMNVGDALTVIFADTFTTGGAW